MANLVFGSAALGVSDIGPDIVAPAQTRIKNRGRTTRSKDKVRDFMV